MPFLFDTAKLTKGVTNAYMNHQKKFMTDVGSGLGGFIKKNADYKMNKFLNSDAGGVVKSVAKLYDHSSGGKLKQKRKQYKKQGQKRDKAFKQLKNYKFAI